MLIALCTLLAASPVHVSLVPQSSAVRLLDESTDFSQDDSASDYGNWVPTGVRIAAEAAAGAMLGVGLAGGGALLGMGMQPSQGFTSINFAPLLWGFLGLEIGEIVGITFVGSALDWHGTIGHVILGKVIGIGAMLLLAPVLGPLVVLIGPGLAVAGFCLISLASGIVAPELFGSDRERRMRSEAPAAVTIRF